MHSVTFYCNYFYRNLFAFNALNYIKKLQQQYNNKNNNCDEQRITEFVGREKLCGSVDKSRENSLNCESWADENQPIGKFTRGNCEKLLWF